jgi:hypothetical protein
MIIDYLITCGNDQVEDGDDETSRDAAQSDFDSF